MVRSSMLDFRTRQARKVMAVFTIRLARTPRLGFSARWLALVDWFSTGHWLADPFRVSPRLWPTLPYWVSLVFSRQMVRRFIMVFNPLLARSSSTGFTDIMACIVQVVFNVTLARTRNLSLDFSLGVAREWHRGFSTPPARSLTQGSNRLLARNLLLVFYLVWVSEPQWLAARCWVSSFHWLADALWVSRPTWLAPSFWFSSHQWLAAYDRVSHLTWLA